MKQDDVIEIGPNDYVVIMTENGIQSMPYGMAMRRRERMKQQEEKSRKKSEEKADRNPGDTEA